MLGKVLAELHQSLGRLLAVIREITVDVAEGEFSSLAEVRLSSSMLTRPTGRKVERVVLVGTCASTYIKHVRVCTWLATRISTDRNSAHAQTEQHRILLPSPADQNDSPSWQIYTYTYSVDVHASEAQSVRSLALDPQFSQLLAPRRTKPLQVCSPAPFANESSNLHDLLINSPLQ